jgi:hypothetical protein
MSEKIVPAGKWKLRPHDKKCKTFVDYDPVVEDQIRCRVPAWTGNFDELVAQLVPHRVALDQLPLLTVHQIGLFMIDTAQGGSLHCGPVGTAKHDIVKLPPLSSAADDEFYAQAAANLDPEHWSILEVCKAKGFVDRATAQSEETITSYVAGKGDKPLRGVLPDMGRQFDLLKKLILIRREKGVGTWLAPRGLAVLGVRETQRNVLRVV